MARHVGYSSLHQHFRTTYISIAGNRRTVMEQERQIKDYFGSPERVALWERRRPPRLEGRKVARVACLFVSVWSVRVYQRLMGFEYVGREVAWIFQGGCQYWWWWGFWCRSLSLQRATHTKLTISLLKQVPKFFLYFLDFLKQITLIGLHFHYTMI